MGTKRVLVATWGSPVGWNRVGYRVKLPGGNSTSEDGPIESESTLKPLIKTVNPDRVILIVLDTLFNAVDKRNKPPKKGFERGFNGNGAVSYGDVIEDVRERMEAYIKEQLGLDYDVRLFDAEKRGGKNAIDLVVAPGVGAFPNVTVEGNVKDFHRYVLYALANLLPVRDLKLYFDMTHGVNYMPVLTYRALGSLLRLLAYVRDVELTVVDSEPFLEGGKRVLNIVPVENKRLEPAPIKGLVDGKEEWNAFISSLANGFPLVFLTFYPDITGIENFLKKKLKGFLSSIDVSFSGDGKYLIRRKARLDEDFKVASKLFYAIRALNARGFGKKEEPSLDELRRVNDTLFRKVPRINHVTDNQLNDLKSKLERYYKKRENSKNENEWNGWCILGSIIWSDYRKITQMRLRSFVRNFIAHSGFEFNITLVKKEETYKFRYDDPDNAALAAKMALTGSVQRGYIRIQHHEGCVCRQWGRVEC